MTAHVERLEFQAEARQLLDLLVHSVYSNKDSFLRELISNASDALDKLRLETLRNKELDVDTSDLHIEIDVDKEARTLTVRDNGIGMTRREVVDLIGTLAKSGTAELRQKLREARTAAASEELIGQFGIGFYSTFMVADRVELLTRKAGASDATRWVSSGDGTYSIESVDDAPAGTSVTLHLKPADAEDGLHDYTAEWKIRELVKKYSDFIAWPIRMEVERRTPDAEGGQEQVTIETQTLNSMKALWAKSKDEVSEEECKEFYKHIAHAWDEPLEIIPMKAEGTYEYQALLFIPSQAPFDLFNRDAKVGVQLYVKRVFVMGDCEQLMPRYLRFVKGVVDAEDLSLNVSREMLQQDRQITAIRRRLTKKILSAIKDMQSDRPEDYRTFWTQFGRVLKEGLMSDFDNQDTLLRICSFASTHSEQVSTTLPEYVERMKEGQEQIFYATGESREQLLKSPHLEAFRAKGYEVLLLTDPVDEIWVGSVPEFDGKRLQSVAKGEVDLDSEDEKSEAEREERQKEFADLLAWLKETLSDHVSEVRLSKRLTDSPACLITPTFGMTPALARMYRASGQAVPKGKRILELNPTHPLVIGLQHAHQAGGDDTQMRRLAETAELLYGTALLAEGDVPDDPTKFAELLTDRLVRTV
ncbi:molecular chaperone HtpG [Mycobacterium heckeshornense]|uniref:Chaperone protein HtpG n=1 Tax=Mycobacterium heckeshornense TaxID=110505 RepID=A0A2G8AWW7_9MYCO|nr:molecular chaperone HtpG [Mycobacterium heckeshornense]KMV19418.1 heat shock protein 90 [Mycobacterium heckeshornense]MCV7035960.1 molecular chaperone HtpG [Mycobacterium heckeshornense]PIJ29967.1 molecular chaperone HtpG [Mycobacterium heckeshornense]BCO33700.1 chaperone protein HtpG [Mycobacterium heckeshornense]